MHPETRKGPAAARRYSARMSAAVILCADPLQPRRPDAHFAREARAARQLGLPVALIDHDALLAGDARAAVARVPRDIGPCWYRGWMIPIARYADLAAALADRGARLSTGPEAYAAAHQLPGWYADFEPVTPRSVWLPAEPGEVPDAAALAALVAPLGGGPGIVKDYVKSRKHEWDEACYVPDLADTARLTAVVARLVELQAESLAGGIVVRAYEPFVGSEARVWWVAGEPALTTAHPDTPDRQPQPPVDFLRPQVAALGGPFATTDLALHEDGRWRVVEVGDGQVGDLPATADPAGLFAALGRYSAPFRSAPDVPLRQGGTAR